MEGEIDRIADSYNVGMDSFKKQIDELRAASAVASPTLEAISAEFATFRTKIHDMLSSLYAKSAELQYRVEELEAKSRRKTLLIHGVKEDTALSPTAAAMNIFIAKLGCMTISESSLESCYRLGRDDSKRTTPRPIVVKFNRRDDRYVVWAKKKMLKGTATLITESLIRSRQLLFSEARTVFKTNKCWTHEGKIVVMYPDGSKYTLSSRDHLEQAKLRLSSHPAADKSERRTALRPRPKKTVN